MVSKIFGIVIQKIGGNDPISIWQDNHISFRSWVAKKQGHPKTSILNKIFNHANWWFQSFLPSIEQYHQYHSLPASPFGICPKNIALLQVLPAAQIFLDLQRNVFGSMRLKPPRLHFGVCRSFDRRCLLTFISWNHLKVIKIKVELSSTKRKIKGWVSPPN